MGIKDLWVTPDPHQKVLVNAEAVPQPLTPQELSDFDKPRPKEREWADESNKEFTFFKAIYQPEAWRQAEEKSLEGSTQHRLETLEGMEQRIAAYVPELTDHSSLPEHQAFMARVAAYDLPIGFCDSYEDKPFWKELKQDADWMLGKDAYYLTGTLDVPAMPNDIVSETVADESSRHGKDVGE